MASKRSAKSGRPAGRRAGSNERGVAKALPERRLVRRASPSALTVLYDQPAGAARVRNQVPLSGSESRTAAGPVPQLDGLALARVPSVNGSVRCFDPHEQQRAGDGARRQWPLSTARLEAR